MVDDEFIGEQLSRLVQYIESYLPGKVSGELEDQMRRILNQVAVNEIRRARKGR